MPTKKNTPKQTPKAKPSAVLPLDSDTILNHVFLLQDALWHDSRDVFNGPVGQPDLAQIIRDTLHLEPEGVEQIRLRDWQYEELDGDTSVIFLDGGVLRYAHIQPLSEWIDDYAERPMTWKEFFAMYAHIDGEGGYSAQQMIYPWECLARLSPAEASALAAAGYPADFDTFLKVMRATERRAEIEAALAGRTEAHEVEALVEA